jgi:DNA-binding SARP family transcriptional activator/TolB-like protein
MLQLRTLGELRLSGADGDVLAGRRKELVLLAYLARRSPRAVRREELIGLFWSERPDRHARQSLRQALLQLRRAVGEGLAVQAESVLVADGTVELDIAAFEADLVAGRLREAVRRWAGEFLVGADEVGGETYRAWLESEREGARRRLAAAFEQLVAAGAENGGGPEAAVWAERWAEALPLDECAHRSWIEALRSDGRIEEAIARHAAFAARLRRELEVDPPPAFLRLKETLEPARDRADPRPRATPGAAALVTPALTGRDPALAELEAAWRVVEQGGSAAVVVEGEDGMGKTMLGERFLHSLEAPNSSHEPEPLVLRARAREEADQLPWGCVRDLLAALADAPGLGGAPDGALAEVSRLVPAIRVRFPRLPQPVGDDRSLVDAVGAVLEAVAEEVPIAVFLDDLPRADSASRDLIVRLARRPLPGVLLLVAARPEWLEPSGARAELCQVPGVRLIKLVPLGEADMAALLGSMIALDGAGARSLAQRLSSETGGNPAHAVEIVGSLVEQGFLVSDPRGVWRTTPAFDGEPLPIPSGVRDTIVRRLTGLGDGARQVAALGAVLDGPLDRERIRVASALPPDRFAAAVDELIARHLLRVAPGRDDALEFARPVIRRLARERLGGGSGPPADRASAWRLRLRGTLAVAAAVAILAALGSMMLPGSEPAVAPVLAVGRLSATGAADPAGVADAVATMLATNLARVPELQVVSTGRMYELLSQLGGSAMGEAAWTGAARQAGAGDLVEGEIHRTDNGLRLDLRLVELRTGTVRAAYTVVGADAFELVDRATAEITAGLGLPPMPLRVADVTTSSMVAYRFYEEALRSYAEGDYRSSSRLFATALGEDSSFAMAAHYAAASQLAQFQPISEDARRRLLTLAERATHRERLLIRAAWSSDGVASRVATAESLVVHFPTEPDGHLLLGGLRLRSGEFLAALPHLRRVVAMDSLGMLGTHPRCRGCEALAQIFESYMLADSAAAAEAVARDWVRLQPRSSRGWHALAEVLEVQGRYAEALAARRNATEIAPGQLYNPLYPAIARLRAGDHPAADRMLRALVHDGTSAVRLEALWFLAISLRAQGRLREALETLHQAPIAAPGQPTDIAIRQHRSQVLFEMGRAREAAQQFDSIAGLRPEPTNEAALARHRSWTLTHLATSLAAAGDAHRLAELADTIERTGGRSSHGRDRHLHHHVRGLDLAVRGQDERAAEEFRRAIFSPTLGYTRTNLELGRLLLKLGRPAEAVAVLSPALRGSLEASNLYVTRTELHEQIGRAWDMAGRPDSAAVHYRLVLSAWRNADPQFAPRYDALAERLVALDEHRRAVGR